MNLKMVKRVGSLLLGIATVLLLVMGITKLAMFGYLTIAIVGIYGILLFAGWKCPKCGKNLGPLWIKCCPNCGERVD